MIGPMRGKRLIVEGRCSALADCGRNSQSLPLCVKRSRHISEKKGLLLACSNVDVASKMRNTTSVAACLNVARKERGG